MKFPSSELQTATDGTGRVSFVMKGLSSERNNAYLVNVAVTNVATGEIATYEVVSPTLFLYHQISFASKLPAFILSQLVTRRIIRSSQSKTKLPCTRLPKSPPKTTLSSSAFA
jgi:hypothetical protein